MDYKSSISSRVKNSLFTHQRLQDVNENPTYLKSGMKGNNLMAYDKYDVPKESVASMFMDPQQSQAMNQQFINDIIIKKFNEQGAGDQGKNGVLNNKFGETVATNS